VLVFHPYLCCTGRGSMCNKLVSPLNADLGLRIQRDSSAAKLAPNVGLEASKGPMGGKKGKDRTHDQATREVLDLENISKILQKRP